MAADPEHLPVTANGMTMSMPMWMGNLDSRAQDHEVRIAAQETATGDHESRINEIERIITQLRAATSD